LKENPLKRSASTTSSPVTIQKTADGKVNFDIVWLKDESLEDGADLPDPDVIAAEIVDDLQAALAQFAEIAADLK